MVAAEQAWLRGVPAARARVWGLVHDLHHNPIRCVLACLAHFICLRALRQASACCRHGTSMNKAQRRNLKCSMNKSKRDLRW